MLRLEFAALALFACSATSLAQAAGGCTDTPITWTISSNYTDPDYGPLLSAFTGDQPDSSGITFYAPSGGKVSVLARLNICGRSPSYDATLQLGSGRAFNLSLANSIDNSYGKFPPSTSFLNQSGSGAKGSPSSLLNVRDIMWCQNNGHPNGCTFYTRFTSAVTGTDGQIYHLRMESTGSIPLGAPQDSTANCLYANSPVKVVFTPAALDPSQKDTYVVTPVLQGINTGTGWVAPTSTAGCPATTTTGTWPSAVGVLILDGTGNSYNYGQYNVPFKFVIRNQ